MDALILIIIAITLCLLQSVEGTPSKVEVTNELPAIRDNPYRYFDEKGFMVAYDVIPVVSSNS